jgi:hypothetical protein
MYRWTKVVLHVYDDEGRGLGVEGRHGVVR